MAIAVGLAAQSAAAAEPRDQQAVRQQSLDAACEAARARALAPERAALVEECVERRFKQNRAACERFYRDYGDATADRPPLHYDLPECERAFEHRHEGRFRH